MANTITDNRTVLFDADSVTSDNGSSGAGRWDTLGSTSETLDIQVKIEGTGSIGEQFTDGVRTLIWDDGATFDISNTHVYMWVNCGIVGLLDLKANGGFTMRFTGPSNSDWFEYDIGGSDSWPTSINGGWTMFVVDTAQTASRTGGTAPAKTAVQGVGISGVTATVMTKVSDNTWIDACWTLPAATPGILIQGSNGGSTPWNSADILTQVTLASGMFVPSAGGAYKINVPLQVGISDTTTHEFLDTNAIWLWDDQEWVAADHYGLSALGNSGGTTNVTFGVKTGSGNDATGAQGLVIKAADAGVRWFMDFDDPDLDTIGFYGCSFIHGATFDLDDAAVEVVSTLYIDVDLVHASNSAQVRISAIQPNTADGTPFMDTDDLGDIAHSTFEFTDGHAIEILASGPATQNNVGNLFQGAYGGTPGDNATPSSGSTDAMIYNDSAQVIQFDRSAGGTVPSFRNGASAESDDEAAITITFTPLQTGSDVSVFLTGSSTPLTAVDSSGTSFAAGVGAGVSIDYKIYKDGYLPVEVFNVNFAASQDILPGQQIDRNFDLVA